MEIEQGQESTSLILSNSLVAPSRKLDRLLRRQKEAWRAGRSLWVEQILDGIELPTEPNAQSHFLLELIDQEIDLRQAIGQKATLRDYQKRFPHLVKHLRNLWDQRDLRISQEDLQSDSTCVNSSQDAVKATRYDSPHGSTIEPPLFAFDAIGRYEIRSELGRGNNGVVYEAWDPSLKRIVALKRLRAGVDASKEQLDRIQSEAEAIARIHHPNIVSIYDVGSENGVPFFAMEICKEGSLAKRLSEGPIEPRLVAKLLIGIASGIAAAHQHRIIHRDLKPGNVLIVDAVELTPKVTDFGLAKTLDSDATFSGSGSIVGTPAYMSPEQANGEVRRVSIASDIYSIGAILYECLTGRPPFRGVTPLETLEHVRHFEPVSVRSLSPNVPTDLETITLKCLQKDPSHRYLSARDLIEDLQRFLSYKPIQARRANMIEKSWRWGKRNPVIAGLVTCLSMLIIASISSLLASNAIILRETNEKSKALMDRQKALADREIAYAKSRSSEEVAKRSFYASQVNLACRAIVAGEVSRAEDLLNSVTPKNLETDFRRFEWYLLKSAIHRDLKNELQFDGGEVCSLAFSPDSRHLLVGGGNLTNGYSEVVDLQNGETIFRLKEMGSVASACDYAPDGKLFVVACGHGFIAIHDATTFETIYSKLTCYPIKCLIWSADSQHLIGGCENGDIVIWNRNDWENPISMIGVHRGPIVKLRLSRDSTRLYSVSDWGKDGIISKTWSMNKVPFEKLQDYPGVSLGNESSDEKHAIATLWGTLRLVDLEDGSTKIEKLLSTGHFVSAESKQGNTKFFGAVRNDRVVIQIDEQTLDVIDWFPVRRSVSSIAQNAQGTILAHGDAGGQVRVWNINRSPVRREFSVEGFTHIGFLPNSEKIVVGSDTENLLFNSECERLSDVYPGKHLKAISGQGDVFLCLRRSENATFEDLVEVCNKVDDTKIQIKLDGPIFEKCLSISSSGRWLALRTTGQTIDVYDLKSNPKVPVYQWKNPCCSLRFSPNEELLVGGEQGGGVCCFHIPTGTEKKRLAEWESFWAWNMSVAYSPDSSLVACGNESGAVHIWNTQTGALVSTLTGNNGPVQSLEFFPNGGRIATGGINDVRIWDIETGQELMTLPIEDRVVKQISINQTGESLIAASQTGRIYCWRGKIPSEQSDNIASFVPSAATYGLKQVTASRRDAK